MLSERERAETASKRRTRRMWVLFALALLLGAVAVPASMYRRQVVAYLTHWKGSPTSTVPYEPYAPDDVPDLHIAVAGDIGDSGSRLDATADAIARIGEIDPYDALLLLGDNVYPNGDPQKLPDTVFGPFAATLDRGAELLAILGNHDVKDDNAQGQVEALGMDGRWWARDLGDTLIVGLDSNLVDDPAQLDFLETTLAASDETWKIVAVHHPPYSAGYQGSDKDVRAAFSPLFERYGVQLVLSGHDHDYQRSEVNGVTYIVTGAAAGTRRTGEVSYTDVSFSWHHFVDLAIFGDHLVGRAVNQDGRVADEFVLSAEQSTRSAISP